MGLGPTQKNYSEFLLFVVETSVRDLQAGAMGACSISRAGQGGGHLVALR